MKTWHVSDIFRRNGPFEYHIPRYQRGYAWEEKELEEFKSDLEDIDEQSRKEDTQINQHFFGSIYTTVDSEKSIIRIVDGQQRITTCAIFLICARDYFFSRKDSDPDSSQRYERLYEILYKTDPQTDKPNPTKFVFRLSRNDHAFFSEFIVPPKRKDDEIINNLKKKTKNDSNDNLADAYDYFSKYLDELKSEQVNSLCYSLLDRFELMNIQVHNESTAYMMFNLINNRGIGLVESDLIKNYLFGRLDSGSYSEQDLDDFDIKWAELRNNITGRDDADYNLDNFFHHCLIAFKSQPQTSSGKNNEEKNNEIISIKLKNIFDEIKKLLDHGLEPAVLLDELFNWSGNFVDLRRPSQNFPSPAKHYLSQIRRIKAIFVYPVLLAGYKAYWEKGDHDSFSKLTEICFKYHIRIKTVGIGLTLEKYQTKLQNLAFKIIHNNLKINEIVDYLVNDEDTYLSTELIKLRLQDLKIKNSNSAIVLLGEIERTHDEDKINGPDVTIEHIMPKSITKWRKYIIEKHDLPKENVEFHADELHKKYCDWLGNQTLLSDRKNKGISNRPFGDKKTIYKSQGYKITKDISNKDDWTRMEIEKRQQHFAEILLDILDIKKCYIYSKTR